MAWPKELVICGKTYTVLYFDSMLDVDPAGEEMLWGWHSPTRREIRVFKGCAAEDVWDTLFHEMEHAMMDECATLKDILGDKEEAFVSEHASVLIDTLRRNGLI